MPIVIRNLETREQIRSIPPGDGGAVTTGGPGLAPTSCCGGAAPADADACCVLDAAVKSAGGSGCGCGTSAAAFKAAGCC